jgi:hypothetical protein
MPAQKNMFHTVHISWNFLKTFNVQQIVRMAPHSETQ